MSSLFNHSETRGKGAVKLRTRKALVSIMDMGLEAQDTTNGAESWKPACGGEGDGVPVT